MWERLSIRCAGRALLVTAALGALAGAGTAVGDPRGARRADCPPQRASAGYSTRVLRALRAKQDVWGNELLERAGGPTYAAARRYVEPLLFGRAARRARLTDSGVHYVPFAQPPDVHGAGSVALHVADGSQVVAQRAGGRELTVYVGRKARERYGSCLARLGGPRLESGYLPILQTHYVDGAGNRYRQESFAARVPETRALVSFVRLSVGARTPARMRLTVSVAGLSARGGRLARGDATYLFFSPGARVRSSSVTYTVGAGGTRTVYAAWLNEAAPSRPLRLDEKTYEAGRRTAIAYWERRLREGATIVVPERRVRDAARALLIQNLELTWRYSIGNPYEEFSFPEGVDVAQVMGELGFGAIGNAILRTSLGRRPTPYPNWKMGEKLLGWASYYRLYRDRSSLVSVTPTLARYVDALGRQIERSRSGILGRERYSSDIPNSVYGFHSQAVSWQGLNAMSDVWAQVGRPELAARCRRLAARLERGLRQAVARSQRRLPDGSLFVPVRLLDRERAYDSLTQARLGSYWNLVMPYALASGFFAPRSPQATGALRYMLRHGSRLLGLVRAGAYALYQEPRYPVSGTDQVYGINASRFLADNGQADQLVLSLYGQLAAAMAPGTFVAGEGATIAPLAGERRRSMYLPPNGASNAAFLETLRLMLVHETRDRNGRPTGLELAYSTPRAWLRPGSEVGVERFPTSFGPLSYSIAAGADAVRVSLEVPDRPMPGALRLRLRLPGGRRIESVRLGGRPFKRFEAGSATIDLSGLRGTFELAVALRSPTSGRP